MGRWPSHRRPHRADGDSHDRRSARLAPETLQQHFGSQGDHFWELAHGIDERPVVPDREAKSISHETTFATDIRDQDVLRAWLLELTEHVGRRVRRHRLRGRTVQIKMRFADFHTITRAHTLPQPTDITEEIWRAADELLERALPEHAPGVRLLGVGLSGFERPDEVQRSLFEDEDPPEAEPAGRCRR